MPGIGLDDFKQAMRRLPAQVVVISSRSPETRIAMTATAVTSLSAEPPQILACVHQQARPAEVIQNAGAFAINLLASSQVDVATQCAMPSLAPETRFDVGSWRDDTTTGQPVLEGAIVNLGCRLTSVAEHGTHFVFVGLIEAVHFGEGAPLLYHDASYRNLGERLDALHLDWDNAGLGF